MGDAFGLIVYFGCIGFILLLNLLVYLVPTIIAYRFQNPRMCRIAIINVLLGWTILGWLVAFVMAMNTPKRKTENSVAS